MTASRLPLRVVSLPAVAALVATLVATPASAAPTDEAAVPAAEAATAEPLGAARPVGTGEVGTDASAVPEVGASSADSGAALAAVSDAEAAFLLYESRNGASLGSRVGPTVVGLRDGAVLQRYERASVYHRAGVGTFAVRGGIAVRWGLDGWENGGLGLPVTEELPAERGGVVQEFQGGTVVWSPAHGAGTVIGAIRSRWQSERATAGLGYPVTGEIALASGGVVQRFQTGAIHYHPATGAWATYGAIAQRWAAGGWETGLGYPTSGERSIPGGAVQSFQNGAIYFRPGIGTRAVAGTNLVAYGQHRWEQGALGFPTTESERYGAVWVQDFERGTITYTIPTGVSTVIRREVQTSSFPLVRDGYLIVNKSHALPADHAPGGLLPATSDAFEQMRRAAASQGLTLRPVSGYRTYAYQRGLYDRYVAQHGRAAADRFSARPGHSEHQTGLALDVNATSGSFGSTPEARWMAANAHNYGFIIRYPAGKEHITGYMFEPWHIRHVGRELATVLAARGLTMEEYFGVSSRY